MALLVDGLEHNVFSIQFEISSSQLTFIFFRGGEGSLCESFIDTCHFECMVYRWFSCWRPESGVSEKGDLEMNQ